MGVLSSVSDGLGREALHSPGDANAVVPQTTPSFQPGVPNNPVVAIFACPGRVEKLLKRPAAGTTGKNLCHLCDEIRRRGGEDFDCYCKCQMMIVNASSNALWKAEHGRTIPNDQEIKDNIANLIEKIRGKTVVLCFGSSARKACRMIRNQEKTFFVGKKVVEVCHLSSNGLKSVRPSCQDSDRMIYESCPVDSKLMRIAEYLCKVLRDDRNYHEVKEFNNWCKN